MDTLTRQKYEAQTRAREWEQRYQESERLRQEEARRVLGQTGPDPIREAEERGRQQADLNRQAAEFNTKADALFAMGQQEFGTGMDDARAALNAAVGMNYRPDVVAALIQLPDGHKVYRKLAANLDHAARIMNLPPMGMAVELARLSETATPVATAVAAERAIQQVQGESPAPQPQITSAPEPVRSVGGTSTRAPMSISDPRMPLAEFFRRRDKEERGSRIRR